MIRLPVTRPKSLVEHLAARQGEATFAMLLRVADRGLDDQDRAHLARMSAEAVAPQRAALRALAVRFATERLP